jgi:hypothetical protein
MFQVVFVVFVVGCIFAFAEWWKGPDIPRS